MKPALLIELFIEMLTKGHMYVRVYNCMYVHMYV